MGTKKEVKIESKHGRRWTRSFGMNVFATSTDAVNFILSWGFTPSLTRVSLRPEYEWRVRQGKRVCARWKDGKRVTR